MTGHDIVVIGASAGGVETLRRLVRDLPADLPAAVFIVVHFPTNATSTLAQILRRAGPMSAVNAEDGQQIVPGRIYVAPPNQHMLVKPGYVKLVRGPKENGFRPAINPLFRTAARAYGPRVVGVVLSGTLDDGTLGLQDVKQYGGTAIVQDPEDALFDAMPRSAIEEVSVDFVLPVAKIGAAISRLAREPLPEPRTNASSGAAPLQQGAPRVDEQMRADPVPADPDGDAEVEPDLTEVFPPPRPGERGVTGLTCPECGGALWELRHGEIVKYQCRVGHSYSDEGLLVHQGEALEAALWTAVRALEERASLAQGLSRRMSRHGSNASARRFARDAREAEAQARLVRQVLADLDTGASDTTAEEGHLDLGSARFPEVS